jgi:predicted NAD-dependent protein-ADP-ribosyltransferase YbiA (DUF1768 family)
MSGAVDAVLFYSDSKDGVTYNRKVTPRLSAAQIRKNRHLSNFYRDASVSFEYGGVRWRDTETPFQYYRWIRHGDADEPADVKAARLEFAELIRNAPTPSKAYFLQSFVKYRKKDGVAYCNAPFPGFREYAALVMSAYQEGVRRPRMDLEEDVQLMFDLNLAKFSQNAALKARLKATGSRSTIVEHTTRDRVWGDGGDGSGQNMLGLVLMRVRDEL